MNKLLLSLIITATLGASTPAANAQTREIEQDMFENMKERDKAAVIAVHFGASTPEARAGIARFNERIRNAFPNCNFVEAWTSRTLLNKENSNGESIIKNPEETLQKLKDEGYTHILLQSSNIVNGIEMQYLRYVVDKYSPSFKSIRMGEQLLSSFNDYYNALSTVIAPFNNPKEANIIVCHGSKNEINAQYTMLDYVLHEKGITNCLVATIEGYPSLDSAILQLQKNKKIKNVNLIPFMFTAGTHVKEDISESFKKKLEKAGYKVNLVQQVLSDNNAILNIYEEHAKHAMKHRTYSAKEIKMQAR